MRRARASGLALLALSACVTARPPAKPELHRVHGEEARVVAWMASARDTGMARQGLRALAALKLVSPSGSGRVREVILVERPSRLRLETLNLLGQTQALLVTDGQSFGYYDGDDFEGGPLEPGLLLEHLGLDLEPDEAVRVLLAAPRLSEQSPRAVYALDQDRVAEFATQRVRFSADGELRAIEELDEHGRVRWIAEYASWRDVEGGRYPFVMHLRFPRSRVTADLELDEVDLNPQLSAGLFTLPVVEVEAGRDAGKD